MQVSLSNEKVINAKPFLKWAGGKTQLLDELNKRLPLTIVDEGIIENYVEPFVGGGAMFFFLRNKYLIKKSYLFDVNNELIIGYKVIQKDHKTLINKLKMIEYEYLEKNNDDRLKMFYQVRKAYNEDRKKINYTRYNSKWIERAVQLIFLNKTCFNGLFRQNSQGEFNVPFGKYKNPTICDENNINEVNKALQKTEIICGDFSKSSKCIERNTLVYLDPPYRPINNTSNFTGYAKGGFNDKDQIRLSKYFEKMDKKGAYLILSNSDPKNEDPQDQFFDKLYSHYKIDRVRANRMINCVASKRGYIYELIITNY